MNPMKHIFKSTEGFFEFLSIFFLLITIVTTFHRVNLTSSILNAFTYLISFILLYLSKKFRRFVIHPKGLIYVRRCTTYSISPLNPESETRWCVNLSEIKIITSKSIELKNLSVGSIALIRDKNILNNDKFELNRSDEVGKNVYIIIPKEQVALDINFSISLEIDYNEEIDEPVPFLEYTVRYKYKWIPIEFWDSRRIT